MEELINEILKAKGFTTFRSPEGADHCVDIIASHGTMDLIPLLIDRH